MWFENCRVDKKIERFYGGGAVKLCQYCVVLISRSHIRQFVLVKHFGFFADPKVPFRTFAAGIFSLTQPESCKSQNAAIFFSEFISSTARGKVL